MKLWHLLLALGVIFIAALLCQPAKHEPDSIPVTASLPPRFLILPHHDLAKPLALEGLSTVSETPDQILLLSPNHQEGGNCNICSYDSQLFASEQGITTLLPLLQDKFPDTPISVYLFKKNTSFDELKKFIAKVNVNNTLIVGSIDFSHYLSKSQADQRDREIAQYIADNNLEKIRSLNSDYLDSPPVLIAMLELAYQSGTALDQIAHGNSSDFTGQANNTTSYFVYSNTQKQNTNDIPKDKIEILSVGDIMMGRSVNTQIQKQNDFSFPVQKIIAHLPRSDLFLANLESPLADNCPQTDSGMIFCADPRSVVTLKTLGIVATTIANNHIGNQGQIGVSKTIDTLNDNGIKPILNSLIISIKNTRIALIAFSDIPPYTKGVNQLSEDSLVNQIKEMKNKSDFIIISLHWGDEYSLANSRQKIMAHTAIDNGADLIIGHHPHWVQEIEEYKGKLIYYSLGNFIFDQMWSQRTREGLIAKITVENNKIVSHIEIPIFINTNYQPEQN